MYINLGYLNKNYIFKIEEKNNILLVLIGHFFTRNMINKN